MKFKVFEMRSNRSEARMGEKQEWMERTTVLVNTHSYCQENSKVKRMHRPRI